MLYSLVIKLRALEDSLIPQAHGHHAYAFFLKLLKAVNSPLSEQLHGASGLKPFTLSSLRGKTSLEQGKMRIIEGADYRLRITFLNEFLFAYFLDALAKSEEEVSLSSASFKITEVATQGEPWTRYSSFESLLENSLPKRKISLEFLSPTAFRSQKRNYLFPEPRFTFESYLSRWNAFSTIRLPESLKEIFSSHVYVSQYELRTSLLEFGNHREIGFEGVCTFEVKEEIGEQLLRQINALADFAFYCGTGAKTTMGMGQTRRIK